MKNLIESELVARNKFYYFTIMILFPLCKEFHILLKYSNYKQKIMRSDKKSQGIWLLKFFLVWSAVSILMNYLKKFISKYILEIFFNKNEKIWVIVITFILKHYIYFKSIPCKKIN